MFELRNLIDVSEAITLSALQRTESRGAHSRLDYPDTDPAWGRINSVDQPRGRTDARHHRSHGGAPGRPADPRGRRRRILMPTITMRVLRGEPGRPAGYVDFQVPVEEGMVVLDALHWIQAHAAPDLAVRWNCKAAKCGSCSAEVNGFPRLTCKTRLSDYPIGPAHHGRADARLPAHPGSRDRCVVELRHQSFDRAVHPAG